MAWYSSRRIVLVEVSDSVSACLRGLAFVSVFFLVWGLCEHFSLLFLRNFVCLGECLGDRFGDGSRLKFIG